MALLDKYNGNWGFEQAKHYLRRTMFGANFQDIEHFAKLGLDATISETIRINLDPITQPINHYETYNPDPKAGFGQQWLHTPYSPKHNADRVNSVANWWVDRIFNQTNTITEKLVLFWHNHFGVSHNSSIDARGNYNYYQVIRTYGLSDFKQLIKEMTVQPLMLQFLNGYSNTSRFPDENYARELMELFTLGKGPESQYTEKDVQEAAKILTGFVHNYDTASFAFFHNRHNADDKVFSDFFGKTKIVGIGPEMSWSEEIYPLIEMIFKKEEVSKFICRKIYRFFVYYEIDDLIENEVITPLAKIFRDNNYNLTNVLVTLFSSQHFYDKEKIVGAMIKSPIDFYFGLIKDLKPKTSSDLAPFLSFLDHIRDTLSTLQQYLPEPPNVAGWPAYYQTPSYYKSWINSETIKARLNLIETYLEKYTVKNPIELQFDLVEMTKQIENAEDPEKLISNYLKYTFPFEALPELHASLKTILLSGQENNYYWTEAWNEYLLNPNDAIAKQTVENRLKIFYSTILHSNEYQLH